MGANLTLARRFHAKTINKIIAAIYAWGIITRAAGYSLNLKEKMSDEDQAIRTCGNSLCVHR